MCKGCINLPSIYILVLLTLINILIYTDRGVLAAVASTLESKSEGLGLSPKEIGAVGSLFMLGYMIAGPIFAHYGQVSHPLTLIAIGLSIWGISTAFTGYSRNFWTLALARSVSGAGEASFVCLAPPYILDNAPGKSKTTWIAIFYSALSIGSAVGYVYGNLVNEMMGGWYWPFYFESLFVIPFIVVCVFGKKEKLKVETEENEKSEKIEENEKSEEKNEEKNNEKNLQIFSFGQQARILGKNLTFIFIVLGFTAFIFTMGGLGFWAPFIVEKLYDQTPRTANMSLGIIILSSGISGTLLGSCLFDCLMRKYVHLESEKRISKETLTFVTTEKANLFLFITTFFSFIFGIAALLFDDFFYFKIFIWFFLFLMYM